MSPSNHTGSIEMAAAEHDGGLDHRHDWARDTARERAAFPRVCGHARIATPSSATHDDAHYAN